MYKAIAAVAETLSVNDKASANNKNKSMRKSMREELLRHYLGDKLFDSTVEFYRKVFTGDFDLVIFIVRRAYDLYLAFKPLLDDLPDVALCPEKYTHSNMIGAWWAKNMSDNKSLNVAVVDDVVIHGLALSGFLRRFRDCFEYNGIKHKIAIYTILGRQGNDEGSMLEIIDERIKRIERMDITLNPSCVLYNHASIKNQSRKFLRAIHSTGTPFVGYMPGFAVSLDNAVGTIFTSKPGINDTLATIELCGDMKTKHDAHDITTKLLRESGVFAFCLFRDDAERCKQRSEQSPRRGDSFYSDLGGDVATAECVSAIRLYVNPNMNRLLVVPYSTLFSCNIEAGDIREQLPKELKDLCFIEQREKSRDPKYSESALDYPSHKIAHRLLRYASAYVVGRRFLNGLDVDYDVVSYGGLPSDSYDLFNFLDGLADVKDGEATDKPFENTWQFLEGCRRELDFDTADEKDGKKLLDELGVKRERDAYGKGWVYRASKEAKGYAEAKRKFVDSGLSAPSACYMHLVYVYDALLKEGVDLDDYTDTNNKRFQGIPWDVLSKSMIALAGEFGKPFSLRDFVALSFRLCNYGSAVTKVVCFDNVMGTMFRPCEDTTMSMAFINVGFAWALEDSQNTETPIGVIYKKFATLYAEKYPQSRISKAMIKRGIGWVNSYIRDKRDSPVAMGNLDTIANASEHVQFFYALTHLCNEYAAKYKERDNCARFKKYVSSRSDRNFAPLGYEHACKFIADVKL